MIHQEYPMVMNHPSFTPAVIGEQLSNKDLMEGKVPRQAAPSRYAPVTVNNELQEAEYEAKGYKRPGKSDARAFETALASPYDPNKVSTEWPKMVNGVETWPPGHAKGGPIEYPKWVGNTLVGSKEEEDTLLGSSEYLSDAQVDILISKRRSASADNDEDEVDRIEGILTNKGIAWKDKPHGTTWTRVGPAEPELVKEVSDRDLLLAEAAEKGVTVDKRWNAVKLRQAIDAHVAA